MSSNPFDATVELSLEDILQPADMGKKKEADTNGDAAGTSSVWATAASAGRNDVIVFPPEVEAAISAVLPSDDPLDRPDFSTLDYINDMFPTEQSLNNLDDVITEMRFKIQCVDDDIRRIVRNQTHVGQDAASALEEAQTAIVQLFTQIRDIKQKAGESESMVRDITRDIKQLDTAKRNLTTSITTLNHLHMLVGGVATLQALSQKRQYGEAAMLLQGLMEVMEHFRNYTEIPQIKELSDQVHAMRKDIGDQVTADFESSLSGENARPWKELEEACLVVDVLDAKVKKNLLRWIVSRELAEYPILFTDGEDGTWLDMVDTRYKWLKKHLIEFEERPKRDRGPNFPEEWEMSELITVEFCDVTKKHFERLMFRRKHEIDTKLLLHAIQSTATFESLLSRRFTGVTLGQYEEKKREEKQAAAESTNPFEEPINDPSNPFFEDGSVAKKDDESKPAAQTLSPFSGIISACFEPYLSIYIESQDKNLSDLVERAASEQRTRGSTSLALEGSAVLHSCGDLFMFYKKCILQCTQLSTNGETMLSLANVFKKHLRGYATKVLISNLPKTAANNTASGGVPSMKDLTKDLKDFSTTGLIQNFQSLLKEGVLVRLTDDEKVLICTFLVTSEYCLETTQQLEGKLKEKVSNGNIANKISLAPEQDVYHSVINNCINMLVQDLEIGSEPALIAMMKMVWSNVESVGDQSPYVTALANHAKQSIPLIRDNLASSRKYFTQFCVKFVNSFIPKFLQHVFRCKPIGTVGAEQLLLDAHSVKTLLLELPSLGSKVAARKAPASYTKIVVKGMTRAEMTLKVVMSAQEPLEAFVEHYIKLVPDVDMTEFLKVLDMKGIRKVDQAAFTEYFRTTAPAAQGQSLTLSPSSAAAASSVSESTASGEESRIKKLENLIKKRL
jgi:archaellum component FlaC